MHTLIKVLVAVGIYLLLRLSGWQEAQYVLYPIILFVSFLHEFGHAFFCVVSGGEVMSLYIDPNTSGVTQGATNHPGIVTMGGYVGSALFGNLLFALGVRKPNWSEGILKVIGIIMIGVGLIWFSSIVTTGMLIIAAIACFLIGKTHHHVASFVIMFLGLASITRILEDHRVGPSSDLAAYEQHVGILPAEIWMYIWFGIAILITYKNVRYLIARKQA